MLVIICKCKYYILIWFDLDLINFLYEFLTFIFSLNILILKKYYNYVTNIFFPEEN